ncbi:MAG: glycoside hydrolase family 95 protein [Cyclobacteriaceae bacterium]|nr:glycoside hydrolase family 95 protein [Cyclobacteriaceae bacterium]
MAILLFGCNPTSPTEKQTQHNLLWYEQPASDWSSEALPIGNGRLGAMIFGDTTRERIQLNEDSLWPGKEEWGDAKGNEQDLEEVRKMLIDGKVHEADEAWVNSFSHKGVVRSHQTMGDLFIDFQHKGIKNYKRQLDLDSALVTVMYDIDGGSFSQKIFTSNPQNVMVIELSSTAPEGINATLHLTRPSDNGHPTVITTSPASNELSMDGMVTQFKGKHFSRPFPLDHGVRFQTLLSVKNEGGSVSSEKGELTLNNVKKAVIYVVAATSFYQEDYKTKNQNDLKNVDNFSVDQLLENHVQDYQNLFHRVNLDLGGHELDSLPTDVRYRRIQEGNDDPDFVSKLFQFGRYLLISSSRPGTNPANLQGIWNEYIEAPWNADYHLNINIQMNYWPAEVTNLGELHRPFFDFTKRLMVRGKKTAAQQYNMRGAVTHHATDLWVPAWMRAERPYWGAWVGGGGWLMQHFWEHYLFTGDKEFLENQAYPVMKEFALFYLDWLVLDPKSGKFVSAPSTSPENSYLAEDGNSAATVMGSAMDQQIIAELFENVLTAAQLLNIDDDFTKEVVEKQQMLRSGTVIGEDGRLLEWDQPYEEPEKGHRHMSHLYAFHPGNAITKRGTPELFEAVRKSLDFRLENGGAGTGWSRAWLINFSARLENSGEVRNHIQLHIQKSLSPNLFDMHPPFQIDGNFGFTAGVAEALLQSHSNEIHFLPAIPENWSKGSVKGLKARGNIVVDLNWDNGQLIEAIVKPVFSGKYIFRYKDEIKTMDLEGGKSYNLDFR